MKAADLPALIHRLNWQSPTTTVNAVVRAVAGEIFVITYDDDTRTEALRLLGQWASDPELPFAWWDAAEMATMIRSKDR